MGKNKREYNSQLWKGKGGEGCNLIIDHSSWLDACGLRRVVQKNKIPMYKKKRDDGEYNKTKDRKPWK